jgi:AbrB family transcriptional regulator, transcriptional pleiotropic regulator of transition state genes
VRNYLKSTGVVRRLDEMGRYVLPINIRRTLNLNIGDGLEIFIDGENIILKKYEPSCLFCGEASDVENYKGKNVCANCTRELKK